MAANGRRETLQDYFSKIEECRGTYLIHDDGLRVRSYTYQQLAVTARQVAEDLARDNIASGEHILLWTENRPEWAAVFWGCVLRGVVVVPIDEKHSADFAHRVASRTRARLAYLGDTQPDTFADLAVRRLRDIVWTTKASASGYTPEPVGPGSPVQILFTSGATAEPKGVVISHRNILANIIPIEREIEKYRRYERPFHPIRFLNLLPLSHMFGQSMALFIPPLIAGEVMLQRSQDPRDIVHTIRKRRISVLVCVPRILDVLRGFLQANEPGVREEPPPGERWWRRWWRYRSVHRRFGLKFWSFVVGGAALDQDLEGFWSRLGFVVIQGYGLTEAAPIVTLNHPFRGSRGTAGKAIGGVEVRVAEDGEILVRGGNVASGYFEDAESTRQLFEDGWLRTGDIGEIDSEGQLRIKGRKKEIIVLSDGRNVFPEDVEHVLNAAPGVRESAVVGLTSGAGEQVHAVMVLDPGANPEEIVSQANRTLEDHQKVRGFTIWPELPRTEGTKKLRRNEVRQRLSGAAAQPAAGRAAEEFEIGGRIVAGDTPLDALGLSSLDRVELLVGLEAKLGVAVDESLFANARTVGDLKRLAVEKPPSPAAERQFESPDWPRRPWARWHRVFHLNTWILNLARLFAWVQVEGRDNLDGFNGPVLFAANHQGYMDTPIVFLALPWRWRHRLAPVMRKEFFDPHFHSEQYGLWRRFWNSLAYYLVLLNFNGVAIPQRESGVRNALRNLGEAVEDGDSLLVFPEGRHSRDESIQPFRPGIGMMASKLRIPVVPVRIRGSNSVLHPDSRFPRPGRVTVKIGKPLTLSGGDYAAIAREVEEAVRAL